MLSLQLENFSSCLAQISIFMQFKPICFCLNPCGHGKQLSRAAVYVLKMVTSQSSILFIFLLNKLQFLLFLVSFLPLYFFFLSIKSFSLSLTSIGLLLLHISSHFFPFTFYSCFQLQHGCTSFFLNIFFQSFWQFLLCSVSWEHVEACCNQCQECVASVWQECMEAIYCNVNAILLSLCRMSFLVLAPAKCCWCSSVFPVSMAADPILSWLSHQWPKQNPELS